MKAIIRGIPEKLGTDINIVVTGTMNYIYRRAKEHISIKKLNAVNIEFYFNEDKIYGKPDRYAHLSKNPFGGWSLDVKVDI